MQSFSLLAGIVASDISSYRIIYVQLVVLSLKQFQGFSLA